MVWTLPPTVTTGEVADASDWNTYVRDNFISTMHLVALKTADTSRANTTTLTDDPHLLFAVGTNERWIGRVQFIYSCTSTTPDLAIRLVGPTGMTGFWALPNARFGSTEVITVPQAQTDFLASGSTNLPTLSSGAQLVVIEFTALNGGTAGNLSVQWAQVTNSASAVVAEAESNILALRAS